jgi:membrane associated rhomboid family serine protease
VIPLRDANRTRRTPVVTLGLIAACFVAFAYELGVLASSGEGGLSTFILQHGLVPTDLTASIARGAWLSAPVVGVFTSLFLHAGWLHLLINLVYLVFFGGAVERRLGPGRFLALYLTSGVVGGLAVLLAQPDSQTPAIGASGAIAGVIAAHLFLFPGATLGTLVPMLFFQVVENVPALLLLLLWLLAQLLSGVVASITAATGAGVAWWAHAGGFASGLALAPLVGRRRRRRW